MKTITRQILFLFLAFLLGVSSLVFAEQSALFTNLLHRMESDEEEPVMTLLQSLSKEEVLNLCNEYGGLVDRGEISGEGWFIGIALNEIKTKGLSFADLLNCASAKSASVHWRQLALRYASGRERFINEQEIDFESMIKTCSGILSDSDAPLTLRCEACRVYADMLVDGYYIAVNGSPDDRKSCRAKVRVSDTDACRIQDKKVATFIALTLTLAKDKDTSEELRREIIRSLRSIVHERGTRTPKLKKIKKFAERLPQSDGSRHIPPGKLLLKEVNAVITEVTEG